MIIILSQLQERQEAEAKEAAAAAAAGSPNASRHNDSTSSNLLGASDSWGSGFPSPVAGGDDDEYDDDEFGADETGIEVEMDVLEDVSDEDFF